MGLWQMYLDFLEPIERYGSCLDWVSPVINETQGYTKLVYSGGYDDAIAHKVGLEEKGIACRIEAVGPNKGNVYVNQPTAEARGLCP